MEQSLTRRRAGSSLRTRVLLHIAAALVVLGAAGWLAMDRIIDTLTVQFGHMIAERQVQYDRYRGMAALNTELALAESFMRAPAILEWLADEDNPERRRRALEEMEHYRLSFSDRSAFVIVDASGNYYFNDAQDSYGDNPFGYRLNPALQRDAWYYATRARRGGCHLNVNVDDVLRVTKVWINCIVTQEGRVLGMVGTGLDFSAFIREVVDPAQPGLISIFVDQAGAVQAHPDASLVDFRSITKHTADKSTVFAFLDSPEDTTLLRAMMNGVRANPDTIRTAILDMDGPKLVGVGYLPPIGWHNITVMDLDAIIEPRLFWPVLAAVAAIFAAVAVALAWIFQVAVLNRIEKVEAGLAAVREGRRATFPHDGRDDEIGRLSRELTIMSDAITEARLELENQVRERTEQLESLINLDALTQINNRRGFEAKFTILQRRNADAEARYGLMLIDIDNFKSINDTAGHAAGDHVVIEVARRLRAALRPIDICARWGGDEFIVLVRDCSPEGLRQVGDALADMMRRKPVVLSADHKAMVTISVGAVLIGADDPLEVATGLADAALYAAKEAGRDGLMIIGQDGGLMAPDSEADSAKLSA